MANNELWQACANPIGKDGGPVEAPGNAVFGGYELNGEKKSYVGRANYEGMVLPGKIIPTFNLCFVGWMFVEYPKEEYEWLVEKKCDWVQAQNGNCPSNAIKAGYTSSQETLYVGRISHEGSQYLGRIQPSRKCLLVSVNGKECCFSKYEILTFTG